MTEATINNLRDPHLQNFLISINKHNGIILFPDFLHWLVSAGAKYDI